MTAKRIFLFIHGGLESEDYFFSNIQAMETTSGPQRKKKQDGEMDDETCMKGF